MTPSGRMRRVAKVAAIEEQTNSTGLARAQQALDATRSHLAQMRLHRRQHAEQLSGGQRLSMGEAQLLRNAIGHLDLAIVGLETQATRLEEELARLRQQWMKAHHRTSELFRIADTRQQQELELAEFSQQLECDERAGRRS